MCSMLRVVLLAVVLAQGARAAPGPAAIALAGTLPALELFKEGDVSVVEYHASVGVPEAARIAASEEHRARNGNRTGDERPEVMIVGGLASYRGEHPFMAGLVIELTSGVTSVCGGSLVSATRVLTAAACYWDGVNQAYSMLVVLGSVLLFSGGTRVHAPSIAVHSAYSPASLHYNLALLTVPYQPSTLYVKPIALASSANTFDGYRAEVIGYGRTADSAPITTSASMRDLFTDVLSTAQCRVYYGDQITAGEVCTSGSGGRNPCGGDQGGPLVLASSDLLIGVFAFGSTAGCSAGAPAGYMRVSYFYNWILANM